MRLGIKLFFLFIVSFNLIYNATLALHPDEAYYWVWSKNLQLSYYDHPPMVSYAIRLVSLLGESEFSIRLAAVGAMTGTAWLIYRMGAVLFDRAIGETALVVYLLIPMTHVGYLAVTPDPFVSFFWALTLYFVCSGLFTKQYSQLTLAGISAGCMLLAKYTGILLPVALLLFLLFTPGYRAVLTKGHFYSAIILALLVFSPVIVWNAVNNWASFSYQFNHGVAETKILNLSLFAEFFAGQAAVSNPLLFFSLLFFVGREPLRHLRNPRLAILVWPFVFTLFFFGYNALYKKSELNWGMPAMISGSVLLAYWLKETGTRKILYYAGVFMVLAILVFKVPELVPFLPGELVLKNQFVGYDALFSSRELRVANEFVLSDTYKNASELSYYLPGHPEVYILEDTPVSQFTFWRDRLKDAAGKDAIWVGQGEPSPTVMAAFARVERDETLVYRDRFITKEYNVYRCKNYIR